MTAILNGPRAIELDGEIFVRLDPSDLDIGDNVRDQVDLTATPEFVESIREHGVLEAISAVQHEDGRIVVRDGQRRTFPGKLACCASRCCPRFRLVRADQEMVFDRSVVPPTGTRPRSRTMIWSSFLHGGEPVRDEDNGLLGGRGVEGGLEDMTRLVAEHTVAKALTVVMKMLSVTSPRIHARIERGGAAVVSAPPRIDSPRVVVSVMTSAERSVARRPLRGAQLLATKPATVRLNSSAYSI